MALFGGSKDKKSAGRKNAGKNVESAAAQSAAPLKKSEMLSSVLDESVPGAALEMMRENVPFKLRMRTGENYVVVLLQTSDIGGLNKHMKNDPDKGQFIECINAGNIDIYVDSEGLEAGYFYLIPSEKTLGSLEEFSFLSDPERFAKFLPVLVEVEDGNMSFTVFGNYPVDFDWLVSVSKGGVSIDNEVLRFEGKPPVQQTPDDDEEDYDNNYQDDYEEPDSGYQEEPSYSEADEDYGGPSEETATEEPDTGSADAYEIECPSCGAMMMSNSYCESCGYSMETEDPDEESDESAEDSGEDVEVTDGEVAAACERVFYAGDLDLKINSDAFDLQFIRENGFVPINEDRGEGWLDSHAEQMAKNANSYLLNLHNANLALERRRYLQILAQQCEDISMKVDASVEGNIYNGVLMEIREERSKKEHEMQDTAEKKRLEMQERWEDELREVQDAAAAAAKRDYMEKFHRSHEAALRDVESNLADEIDIDYNKALAELNAKRKNDAAHLMDIAIAQTLLVMEKDYARLLEDEQKYRDEMLDAIQAYVDEHRKEDVARIEVLKKELDSNTAVEAARRESERKIAEITDHYTALCDKLHQEIDASQKHAENIRIDFTTRLDSEKDRNDETERKYDELMTRYAGLHDELEGKMASEYEDRLGRLTKEKEALEAEFDYVNKLRDKNSKFAVGVWVAVAVATFCIGCIFGHKILSAPANAADKNHLNISVTAQQEPAAETENVTE